MAEKKTCDGTLHFMRDAHTDDAHTPDMCIERQLRQAKALLAEQQAVIDKLPKDAEGKPVIPCVDSVWIRPEGFRHWLDPDMYYDVEVGPMKVREFRVLGYNKSGERDEWLLGVGEGEWWDGPVYLDREEAAKGADK